MTSINGFTTKCADFHVKAQNSYDTNIEIINTVLRQVHPVDLTHSISPTSSSGTHYSDTTAPETPTTSSSPTNPYQNDLRKLENLVELFENTFQQAYSVCNSNEQFTAMFCEIKNIGNQILTKISSTPSAHNKEARQAYQLLANRANSCKLCIQEAQKAERKLFINIFEQQPEAYLGEAPCQQ